jgi:MtfA peptidase
MIKLFRRWLRRGPAPSSQIPAELWTATLERVPFLKSLTDVERTRLYELANAFLATKEMHGAAGLVLTDAMRTAIAAQACLPVLELGLHCYDGWVGVIVYPHEFRVQREEMDDAGVLHQWDEHIAGESMHGGPVVISWEDADTEEIGYSVVIHEFAHKLDGLDDQLDGIPPVPPNFDTREWQSLWESHFKDFADLVDQDEDGAPFDPYAAEHPAEFFPVMSEAFFTDPEQLHAVYPELYDAMRAFYRQDPLSRPR